jgi:uncharacterized membrane protein YphA (DoxX/SURF4 family)
MALTRNQSTLMWVLSVLLAALFVFAGVTKLIGVAEVVEGFERYGYPGWFRILIGLLELAGGIGLLIPKVALEVASFLIIVMLGAVFTELFLGENVLIPLVVLLAVGGTAALRAEE